jgi:hypothetical protein
MGLSEPPVQDGKQGEAGRSAQAPEHTLRRGILERDGGDQQRMGRTRLWQRRGASDAVLIVVSRRPVPTCATRPPMPTTSIASAVVVPNPAKSTITSKLTPSNSLMLFVRPAGVLHVRPLATTARGPAAARDERPEAEWGFEPALRADVEAFAQQRGYHYRGWYADSAGGPTVCWSSPSWSWGRSGRCSIWSRRRQRSSTTWQGRAAVR